ncbi:hypothetical protein EW145_g2941 [Phellinidium pouzarii]|uniref:HMG box domain-containing protein n=1 Tax=Phellinidium pouzarii TaxID=167371 RepID=A0A4V3XD31_9AGAM|nr:hypothetical protein EW145_g2941 [Phellinidium pouzarii]
MVGPDRVPHSRDARFHPIPHIIVDPSAIPSGSASKNEGRAKQPPRPQNAWILYRQWALSKLLEAEPELKGTPQSQLSKRLGNQWKNESDTIRLHFEQKANIIKERHAIEHPGYSFRPVKREDKQREREEKKQEKARAKEAEKLAKELEKALRAQRLSRSKASKYADASEGSYIAMNSNVAAFYGLLGPSPPLSKCPSHAGSPHLMSDELLDDHPSALSLGNASPLVGSAFLGSMPTQSASTSPINGNVDASPQMVMPFIQSNAMGWTSDVVVAEHAPRASSAAISDNWPQVASDGATDDVNSLIDNWLFFGGQSGLGQSFANPSGPLSSPPHYFGGMQLGDMSVTGDHLVGIHVDTSVSHMVDQFHCDFTNPYQEQSPAVPYDMPPPDQQNNEAPFLYHFLASDMSPSDILGVESNVGNVLMDEVQAREFGGRVIAAEHIQDRAPPVMTAENVDPSTFLPSPPESASSVSPVAGMTLGLDGTIPTNLSASSSNQQALGNFGFEDMPIANNNGFDQNEIGFGDLGFDNRFEFDDNMTHMDPNISEYSVSAYDFYDQSIFASNLDVHNTFEVSAHDHSNLLLQPNFDVPDSSMQMSTPPTPVSAGSTIDDQFAIVRGPMRNI